LATHVPPSPARGHAAVVPGVLQAHAACPASSLQTALPLPVLGSVALWISARRSFSPSQLLRDLQPLGFCRPVPLRFWVPATLTAVCRSLCLLACLLACVPACLPSARTTARPSDRPPARRPTHPLVRRSSVCLSVCVFVSLVVSFFVSLFRCRSASACLSVYLRVACGCVGVSL
jgi:hypothetical protein